jgi:hypothetical protein
VLLVPQVIYTRSRFRHALIAAVEFAERATFTAAIILVGAIILFSVIVP